MNPPDSPRLAGGNASPADAPAPEESALLEEDVNEENIYEVMKAHMRRQKEELDAKNLAAKQQSRAPGRPGAQPPAPPAAPEPAVNPADLPAVWAAARRWLQANASYLERVLGHCCSVAALDPATGDALLHLPANQRGFANERARLKLEEALRAVTRLPIKLALHFTASTAPPPPPANTPDLATQRIAPELLAAVKDQPLVKQLMKNLDATVVHIEMLNTNDAE
ncbi:MAG TPA: hypothetical protein VH253_15710 [Phycisphaerae bacterium]|nr:hypothetical protein [Phycisphaerae bacterium]